MTILTMSRGAIDHQFYRIRQLRLHLLSLRADHAQTPHAHGRAASANQALFLSAVLRQLADHPAKTQEMSLQIVDAGGRQVPLPHLLSDILKLLITICKVSLLLRIPIRQALMQRRKGIQTLKQTSWMI